MDEATKALDATGGEEESEELEQLWEMLREGDRASIEALLVGDEEHPPLGCSVDVKDPNGMTPLHLLAVEGHSDVVEWLVDEVGADIECGDARYGQTALHFAATKDNARTVEQLLDRGAKPLATCNAGWTPLHAAAHSGSVGVVTVLLAALPAGGADARGPGGQTPLHRAAFWGQTEVVQTLLDAGATRGILDDAGRAPVQLICDGGHRCTEVPALQKLLRSPPPVYK
mmetsp:Transcript_20813/g.53113  ORF Transcript_20813/g.53113 Transcript_20813/m.53113 type:complete len:228 (-) Transcript_20813:126-809(-)